MWDVTIGANAEEAQDGQNEAGLHRENERVTKESEETLLASTRVTREVVHEREEIAWELRGRANFGP